MFISFLTFTAARERAAAAMAGHNARIADPFVAEGIVTAEIHEIDAKRWVPALTPLLAPA